MNKILLSCVTLLFVGCVDTNNVTHSNQHNKISMHTTNGTEGDGHTETLNNKTYCNLLKLPTSQYIKCTKNRTLQYANLGYIGLSKGSKDITIRTIHIDKEAQKLILLIDVWNVSLPLKVFNMPIKIRTTDKTNYKILEININDIKNNRVVIKDNNNQKLMILNIIR